MKKRLLLALIAFSSFMTAGSASADYYFYNEDLRTEGQTIEQAKETQEKAYQQAMSKKYSDIRLRDKKYKEKNQSLSQLSEKNAEKSLLKEKFLIK